ncbi:DnaJ domain-containing protein [Capilliphycus salinus ALCB114379]|uniref:DnaJ domain-containing protein n=1 Tax=Capilliphycus salinus TaxID=2768948 RepID=UPI0039A4EAFD
MDEIEYYYRILNLQPGASLEDVKQAYRNLALIWHPDRYPLDSRLQAEAEQKFKEINYAYVHLRSRLSDPEFSVSHGPTPSTASSPPPTPPEDNPFQTSRVYQETPQPVDSSVSSPDSPVIPWGWLAGTFLGYTLIGWVLTALSVPLWNEILAAMLWAIVAILASMGERFEHSWFIALMVAGGMAGWVAGNQAAGIITGVVWAIVGLVLGAIAGSQARVKGILWILTLVGISAIAGLVAGSKTGDWRGALLGGMLGAVMGTTMGLICDRAFQTKPRRKTGAGSVFGFGFGAWLGAWTGAGENAVIRAIEKTGLEVIFGAWAAIILISGAIAQMVAGEKLIESFNGFYTFMILATTSGLGLTLGYWLANKG